ncbi:MAG: tripartite tricarboxylate transporter substrate binding protein [Betaproteobacteria bacterium]|nr:tripartite tricarboxylate transporter substrate binding protein [Betaproteobacteria bacterium]
MWTPARSVLRILGGIIVIAHWSAFDSSAQSYPVKPIRIFVGFAVGGSTEVVTRVVAQRLSEQLGQPMVVETRPGASGAIATETVATSSADGYTLLMLAGSTVVQSSLRSKLPYDVARDLAPVSLVVNGPLVLVVHPSVPADKVEKLIAYARSRPGKLTYGSDGTAGVSHLAGELLKMMAKVNIVHVPYKGGGAVVIGIATGDVDMAVTSITAAQPFLSTGKLRALAVSTLKRVSSLPAIPTLNESGLPGYDYSSWQGVVGPAGMPKGIIAQLNAAISKTVNTPEMKGVLSKLGREVETNTPEQFAKFIDNQMANNTRLAKFIGFKVE